MAFFGGWCAESKACRSFWDRYRTYTKAMTGDTALTMPVPNILSHQGTL